MDVPKKVDHGERRRLIADALLRVAAEQGLEAVSLRHVAAEAGVSTGMVQHYFGTKDEMMTFALDVVGENVQARLAADAAVLAGSPSPRALVRALAVQMLPLDEVRVREGRVGLAFLAYAAVKPDVAVELRQNTARMREYVAGLIRGARGPGPAGGGPMDPDHAATGLLALVEGLAMHVLGGHYAADVALAVFDAQLDVVFGPAGHADGGAPDPTVRDTPAGGAQLRTNPPEAGAAVSARRGGPPPRG